MEQPPERIVPSPQSPQILIDPAIQPPRNKSRRRLWLLLLLVVVLGGLFYIWKKPIVKSTAQSKDQIITITDPRTPQHTTTVLQPAGWISAPYFPSNTGAAPIVLFPTSEDQTKAVAWSNNTNNMTDIAALRGITGQPVSPSVSDLTSHDKLMQAATGYVKILTPSQSFTGGEYRCAEDLQNNNYRIQCFAYYTASGTTGLFSLTSDGTNLDTDLTVLSRVIASASFK